MVVIMIDGKFEYEGECRRCLTPCGTLNGERTHTFAGLIFAKKIFRDGKVFCDSPVFPCEVS